MYEQYYTEQTIGKQLIKMLPRFNVERCVELSAGQGALLEPVVRRWPLAQLTTCELDPANVEILKEHFEGAHYNIDVLDGAFENLLSKFGDSFDLAISNPPYRWRTPTSYDRELITSFGLQDIFKHKRLRTEVLFILQNIRLLRDEGFAAFILPELVIKSDYLKSFRSSILNFCSVVALAEIVDGKFKGTEARTYILVIQKTTPKQKFTYSSLTGIKEKRPVSDFVNGLRNMSLQDVRPSILFDIKRGNLSGKECKQLGTPYYHTSGFFDPPMMSTCVPAGLSRPPILAEHGDILISRVGTRVLGNITIVECKSYIISDCVFRLRFTDNTLPTSFIQYWNSQLDSLRANARGTCAKYITKHDLSAKVYDFLKNNHYHMCAI
ncbi:N-6 DNA methylase [Pseudomonas anatoliensis]|uniref:N-6 DNA methylase n=1 Tax=Pseudomonas anatoliensis TaxID=2710589 RepID=UPI001B335D8C|nr:N-6 DNA methylase [Pseudomonas anatoliensis]